MGLGFWFHFDVDIQRHKDVEGDPENKTVRPGDLLHCDVGLCYKGLKTDTQRLAYVLGEGEIDAPVGLKALLRSANQFQDIVSANFYPGRTGNEILAKSLAEAKAAGLDAALYNHPIGVHGHAAGPIMGLWDHQEGVPGRGDYPLYGNTCHALELNVKMPVPEWGGKVVQAGLEQTVAFTGDEVVYLDGRQTALILV
jgi:Xaa-Pro aminopeptidase